MGTTTECRMGAMLRQSLSADAFFEEHRKQQLLRRGRSSPDVRSRKENRRSLNAAAEARMGGFGSVDSVTWSSKLSNHAEDTTDMGKKWQSVKRLFKRNSTSTSSDESGDTVRMAKSAGNASAKSAAVVPAAGSGGGSGGGATPNSGTGGGTGVVGASTGSATTATAVEQAQQVVQVPAQGSPEPDHSKSRQSERRAVKQRGSSATSSTTSAESTLITTAVLARSTVPSKSRNKKFHRHFDTVAPDEKVIDYYSCALIGDILLQGHLYITDNYFAFYSNVFGYITKLLIPTATVLKVSKEKTGRIFPNAVGVATSDYKHVFGSLLSRETTYNLMVQVWKSALDPAIDEGVGLLPELKDSRDEVEDSASGDLLLPEDDDSSLSGSGIEAPLDHPISKSDSELLIGACDSEHSIPAQNGNISAAEGFSAINCKNLKPELVTKKAASSKGVFLMGRLINRSTLILSISTILLVILFASAAVMLYRISQIQDQFRIQSGDDLYLNLARWQSLLHLHSSSQVEEFLDTHLAQLAKVRQSLEALSLLIIEESNSDRIRRRSHVARNHDYPHNLHNQYETSQDDSS